MNGILGHWGKGFSVLWLQHNPINPLSALVLGFKRN